MWVYFGGFLLFQFEKHRRSVSLLSVKKSSFFEFFSQRWWWCWHFETVKWDMAQKCTRTFLFLFEKKNVSTTCLSAKIFESFTSQNYNNCSSIFWRKNFFASSIVNQFCLLSHSDIIMSWWRFYLTNSILPKN